MTNEPSQTDYAWAAGIIDGEGCIFLQKRSSKPGRLHYILHVVVTNTSPRMIARLQELFGGDVQAKKPQQVGWRPAWVWRRYAGNAAKVLTLVLPYLVTKRDEAEVALLSRSLTGNYKRGVGARNPNTPQLGELSTKLRLLKTAAGMPSSETECARRLGAWRP